MDVSIEHEEKYQQFTVKLPNDEEAELAYALPEPGIINFTHTFVPEESRGQGIADQLIAHGLAYATEQQLKVIASCQAVATYLERHPEHKSLLKA